MKQLKNISLVWYKMNDLRLLDHHPLFYAHKNDNLIAHVFFFDLRFTSGFTQHKVSKMTSLRSKFLKESVLDLKQNLQKKGSDLFYFLGQPEQILPQLIKQYQINNIYYYSEICYDELQVIKNLKQQCQQQNLNINFKEFWGNTVFDIEDLPFQVKDMPKVYTPFNKRVINCNVQQNLDIPNKFKELLVIKDNQVLNKLPTDEELKVQIVEMGDNRSVLNFIGGETQGMQRIQEYIWDKNLLKTYADTRNQLLGGDYSSKFSPWLSLGCISPRFIWHEIKKYEKNVVNNESTKSMKNELLWRDFFRFFSLQQGNKIFQLYGTRNQLKQREWIKDYDLFQLWCDGKTGYPFIDANMIELKLTGFMSNRGRQVVASFLINDLQIDWRMGAEHFEAYLLDYDPCSNYCNWNYAAGVGTDTTPNRYFSLIIQAKKHDPDALYIQSWLPQLKQIPSEYLIDINKIQNYKQKYQIGKIYPDTCVVLKNQRQKDINQPSVLDFTSKNQKDSNLTQDFISYQQKDKSKPSYQDFLPQDDQQNQSSNQDFKIKYDKNKQQDTKKIEQKKEKYQPSIKDFTQKNDKNEFIQKMSKNIVEDQTIYKIVQKPKGLFLYIQIIKIKIQKRIQQYKKIQNEILYQNIFQKYHKFYNIQMDMLEIFKKQKEQQIMEMIKQNGVYNFLIKKLTELYELPEKPESPLQYLKDNLTTQIVDRQFLVSQIEQLRQDNELLKKNVQDLEDQIYQQQKVKFQN